MLGKNKPRNQMKYKDLIKYEMSLMACIGLYLNTLPTFSIIAVVLRSQSIRKMVIIYKIFLTKPWTLYMFLKTCICNVTHKTKTAFQFTYCLQLVSSYSHSVNHSLVGL